VIDERKKLREFIPRAASERKPSSVDGTSDATRASLASD